jgi:hypothetical protein
MKNLFGLLAFAGLIAAQFLAVVVTYSERFEGNLRGGRRCRPSNDTGQTPATLVVSTTRLQTLMFRR